MMIDERRIGEVYNKFNCLEPEDKFESCESSRYYRRGRERGVIFGSLPVEVEWKRTADCPVRTRTGRLLGRCWNVRQWCRQTWGQEGCPVELAPTRRPTKDRYREEFEWQRRSGEPYRCSWSPAGLPMYGRETGRSICGIPCSRASSPHGCVENWRPWGRRRVVHPVCG